MKTILSLVVSLAIVGFASGQENKTQSNQANPPAVPKEYFKTSEDKKADEVKKTDEVKNDDYALSKFALSVNPLGFVQFGPLASAEIGLSKSMVLNLHVRFPSLGLLTYAVNYEEEGLDKLSGIAFGGGPIYFFGKKRSKPYLGVLLDFEMLKKMVAKDETWEWEETDNTGVFIVNGGYRFRFKSGFFINTGAFLGVAMTSYKWKYTDPDYVSYEDEEFKGTDIYPGGMVEVTVGIEF